MSARNLRRSKGSKASSVATDSSSLHRNFRVSEAALAFRSSLIPSATGNPTKVATTDDDSDDGTFVPRHVGPVVPVDNSPNAWYHKREKFVHSGPWPRLFRGRSGTAIPTVQNPWGWEDDNIPVLHVEQQPARLCNVSWKNYTDDMKALLWKQDPTPLSESEEDEVSEEGEDEFPSGEAVISTTSSNHTGSIPAEESSTGTRDDSPVPSKRKTPPSGNTYVLHSNLTSPSKRQRLDEESTTLRVQLFRKNLKRTRARLTLGRSRKVFTAFAGVSSARITIHRKSYGNFS